jgi:multidrug transporter EmrE-like cation transporter
MWPFYVAMGNAFVCDYLLKYSADHQSPGLLSLVCILFGINSYLWYLMYQQERFIIMAGYYAVVTVFKDVFLSQIIFKEAISCKEGFALGLVFLGALLLNK